MGYANTYTGSWQGPERYLQIVLSPAPTASAISRIVSPSSRSLMAS